MGVKIVEMVDKLVELQQLTPDRQQQELNWLGLRHVKYQAEPHHVPLMGQALVRVIRLASGEAWREEYHDMWTDVWDKACECMITAMKEGKQHGEAVQGLWDRLQKRTTPQDLGVSIVQHLMTACPEFLQSMTEILKEDETEEDSSEGTGTSPETASVIDEGEDDKYVSRIGRIFGAGRMLRSGKSFFSSTNRNTLDAADADIVVPPKVAAERERERQGKRGSLPEIMEEGERRMPRQLKRMCEERRPTGDDRKSAGATSPTMFLSMESAKSGASSGKRVGFLKSMQSTSTNSSGEKLKPLVADSWRQPPQILGTVAGEGKGLMSFLSFKGTVSSSSQKRTFGLASKSPLAMFSRRKKTSQLSVMMQAGP